jgi:iron complex outermembrane receptor protein
MKLSKFFFWQLFLVVSLAIPFQSQAQLLEEVIVTAQKREQGIQDVSISITALTGNQLRNLGLSSTLDFDDQVPGLQVTDFGNGSTTQFTIRGSAQLDFADHHETPVAVYVDKSYNSYVGGVGGNFFDVERIEVLRGPQGTLYGRNATGGVVQLISKAPTQEKDGYLEVTAGEFSQIKTEGALGGGLTDTLAGRLSFSYENDDGYQKNTMGDDLNDMNNISLRGQLLFEPNDDLSILINTRYAKDDVNGQGYDVQPLLLDIGGLPGLPGDGLAKSGTTAQQDAFCGAFFGPGFPIVPGATDCFGYTEPNDGDNTVSVDEVGFFKRQHWGMTGTIEWDLQNGMQVVSITDFQDFDKRYLEDTDSTPAPLFTFGQDMNSKQISQEFQLHGETDVLNWVAGFYYLNIDSDFRVETSLVNCCLVDIDNDYTYKTESYAFFLQGEYELTEQFSFTAGFRWTEDEKKLDGNARCIDDGSGLAFGLPGPACDTFFGGTVQVPVDGLGVAPRENATTTISTYSESRSEGEWSAVFQLDWRPNDDWLVYGKYTRGNKAGGFNSGAVMLFAPNAIEFGGEILNSYETGFKSTLFGGKARLNASVYYYDYQDFQNFSAQGINLIVFNNDAENIGAEIELIANPMEGLELMFGVSLQDAKQKDLEFSGVTRDRAMANAPDLTFNGVARYEWPMSNGSTAAQIDFSYVGDRSVNGIDHPGLYEDSFLTANARLGYATADGKWEASLWVKNFTDENYVNTSFDLSTFLGTEITVPNKPRWFGGSVRYNFF